MATPSNPGRKPLLIFDGKCGFCRIWIEYWKKLTGDSIDYAPSQEVAHQFPAIPREAFAKSIQFVRIDGTVASGARAVFETLGRGRQYESLPLVTPVLEASYRFIAGHRDLFYWITRLSFGTRIEPARFARTQWLFLRMLAVIYAIAFGSLATQITGLVGSRGIAPVHQYLGRISAAFGTAGPVRFLALPTVFWWNSSDALLRGLAWAGVGLAALLFVGGLIGGLRRWLRWILLALYVLYLSFNMAGQEFLSFQWDSLLLEAGFLAIFFGRSVSGARTIAWLYRCLLFRLYFLSGYVKVGSHDPSWASFTALKYHYYTQPLPTVIAWYADKLPDWFQRASTAGVLGIELFVPFLIFAPRRWRMAGAYVLLGLQVLIFLTGNYTFFNLLTMALTVFLFDDQALEWLGKLGTANGAHSPSKRMRMASALLVVAMLGLGAARLAQTIEGSVFEPLETMTRVLSPFQIVNSYGLFAVMTTTRPEIIIEGSDDGETWLPYEFPYKPGNLNRAPRWIEPFQPRLDWQMWFAALGTYQSNPWFPALMLRLLEGSPEVLGLFEHNPFPNHPPRLVRAELFEYSFTSEGVRSRSGAWWKRVPRGLYMPPVGLKGSLESPN